MDELLSAALEYAEQGIPVFPVVPRGKRPLTEHGFKDACTDTEKIRRWWTEQPDANIGIPTGLPTTFDVLDVDTARADGSPNGLATLRDLERRHGKLATRCVLTQSGGYQYLFTAGTLPNGNARLAGIDVKSLGGYVVAPPSVGATGNTYRLAANKAIAEPPRWLLEELGAFEQRNNGNRPTAVITEGIPQGERNNTLASLAGSMRRRGASEDAIAAALLVENETRCAPPLDEEEVRKIAESVSRYEPAPAVVVDEDWLDGLDEQEDDDPLGSWRAVDIVAVGNTPPDPPDIADIFYSGKRILVSGESEALKTWLALCAAVEEMKSGHGVVWVDLDNMGERDLLERLRSLGAEDDVIRSHFLYFSPSESLNDERIRSLLALVAERDARMVVFDAFNGALTLHGCDPNSSPDVDTFWRTIADPFCHAGAAVICIDHLTKNKETRGKYSYGSERKHSGSHVHLQLQLRDQFGRERTGRATVKVHKDRGAYLKRPVHGILTLASEDGRVSWRITEDTSASADYFRPTRLMERVSRFLEEQKEGVSQTRVEERVSGKTTHVREALAVLVREDFVDKSPGPRGDIYRSIRRYREIEDEGPNTFEEGGGDEFDDMF